MFVNLLKLSFMRTSVCVFSRLIVLFMKDNARILIFKMCVLFYDYIFSALTFIKKLV